MLRNCPDPVDEQDIHFKLHCRLKVFENKDLGTFAVPHNLISCASRYGLLFVGSITQNLQAIQVSALANYTPKDKDISNYQRRSIPLPSIPRHVSVNSDNTILAVVIEQDKCPVAVFYDVLSFYKQSIQCLTSVRLSANPGTFVTEVNWNPAIPAFFTACKSDGSIGIYELKGTSIEINEIPPAAEASTFCWSPKGKQIAVGSRKGTITQYKPDLKAVRMINAPPLGGPVSLISLQWISNYQFIGIYQYTTGDVLAKLIVVDAPKTGETVYTNYDDVCYSGSSRIAQFFMILQQHWNILMVASSNSAELAVLGLTPPESWTQWIISDSSRAELPLSSERQETLPIGFCIDISNIKPYPWGESTLAPCPYVLMLSHQGVLCIFNLVNLKNVPSVCTPPEPIQDQSGLSEFYSTSESLTTIQENPNKEISHQTSSENLKKPQNEALSVQPHQTKSAASSALQSNATGVSFFTPQVTTTSITQSTGLFSFSSTPNQAQKTLFGEKLPESQSLFSTQATITPMKPKVVGKSMFEQISITPITKTQPASNKTLPDEKYSAIFSSLNNPQSTTDSSFQLKPIVISTPANKTVDKSLLTNLAQIPISNQKAVAQSKSENMAPTKFESSNSSKSEATFSAKPLTSSTYKTEMPLTSKLPVESSKTETEAILKNMFKEDCQSLENELKAVTQKGKLINVNLGSDEDKIELLDIIQNLEEFLEEISEISMAENSEIHTLKQNVVLSWSWYEEALSRYNTSKNGMMKLLIKSQPLDSATEKRYNDIKKLVYYIESQLLQVSKALDEQWDKFQDYVKKTHRVQTPTMEAIYQAMVRQNAISQKQGYIVKDISSRLKKKHQTAGGPLLLSVNDICLEDELKRLQVDSHDNKYQLYEKAVAQSKKISRTKSKKLHLLLKNREVAHITTIKSYFPSETFQSPNKRLSLLGTKMSPVVPKLLESKKVDFSQSTPLRNFTSVENTSISTISDLQTNKPIHFGKLGVTSFKTSEVPVTMNTPTFSISTRSQVLSSNVPSAFISTAQTASIPKERNTSAFSVPTTIIQTSSNNISECKTSTTKQIPFSSNFGPEMRKPLSSASSFSSSATTFSTFSFTTSVNSTLTSNVNTFSNKAIGSNTLLGDTKNISSGLSLMKTLGNETPINISNDQSTFFGSIAPKTSSSIIQKTNKTSKTTPNLTSTSAVTNSNVLSFETLSAPCPVTQISTPASDSTQIHLLERALVSGAPAVSTFSFASKTVNPATTSDSYKLVNPNTAAGTFGATSTPVTTIPLFTTQGEITTPSFSFGSNTLSSVMNSNSITTVSSNSKMLSAGVLSGAKLTPVTSSTSVTMAAPTPSVTTTTVVKSTSPIILSNVTTATSSADNEVGSMLGVTSTTSSFSFVSSGTSNVFGVSTTTSSNSNPLFASKPTSGGSFFGTVSTCATASTAPLFGANNSIQSTSSLFGQGGSPITTTKSISTIFASAATSTFEATTTSSTPTFSSTTMKPTSLTLFGSNTPNPLLVKNTTVSSPSIFGNAAKADTASNPSQSIFGQVATSQPSVFDQSSNISSSSTSIFGSPTTTTTQSSIFGLAATTTTQNSLFGGSANQGSIFGSSANTSASAQPSIFGSTTTAIAKPVFGSSTSNAPMFASTTISSSTPFGQPATNSFGSTFGTSSVSPLTTTASVFGQQSSSTFGSNTGSIFGGGTQSTTVGSIFGTNTSGSTTFGAVSSSGSIFGSTAASSFSFASTPGSTGESALNFGSLNVNSTTTTTAGSIFGGGSIFGSATTEANPFGRTPEKSAFGGGSNLFGNTPTTGSPFGTSSTFGGSNQSTFGSTSFVQQQPMFGQSTFGSPTSFGNTQPGPFSGGGAGVGQSGFGSSSGFQKPSSGFGSSPVFGGSPAPAFGGSPSFGGAPAFGAAPTFGSPTKIFGSNTPTAAFGSSAPTGSPGFGNIANQDTIGFGNLAKQATNSPSTAFSGNSSFSSWR